jgi:hypothetical protein
MQSFGRIQAASAIGKVGQRPGGVNGPMRLPAAVSAVTRWQSLPAPATRYCSSRSVDGVSSPRGFPLQDLTRPEQHEPQAEAHAPQAEAHEPQAEAHEPQAEAHEPQAEAHEPQAEAHEPQAEAHAPQAEAHAPQAEAHEPQAEAHA